MNQVKYLRISSLALSLATAMGGVVSTLAVAADGPKIEVIKVTAQKRSQSINDVPMAISALNADDMSEMGIENTTDLATVIPGFNFSDTAFGPPVYTLRGVGFNESSSQATSTVGVYVDEIAIPYPIMTKGATLDMERVEILKGPQGTLYGRNSTAGAVNYIAAKPQNSFEAGFTGSYGSFQTLSTEGYVTGGLSDNIDARLAIKSVQSGEGWQESISRDETLGEQDKLSMRLSLAFDLGAGTEALFRAGYAKDDSESIAPQALRMDSGNPGRATPIIVGNFHEDVFTAKTGDATKADWTKGATPAVDHETISLSLNVNHDLSDTMSLTSLTGFSTFKDDGSEYERAGIQGTPAGLFRDGGFGPSLLGEHAAFADDQHVVTDYVTQHGEIDSFSQEFRITEVLDNVVWMAGVYFSSSEVQYDTNQNFGLSSNVVIAPVRGLGLNQVLNNTKQENKTIGAFVNADWLISDDLTVTTGLRYSEDTADYTGCTKDIDGGFAATMGRFFYGGDTEAIDQGTCITILNLNEANQTSGLINDTLKEDSLSWRLAANYKITDDTSVYSSYSRGFKAGSFPTLAAIDESQLKPVVQEQLDAYEIGIKTDLADGAAHLNAAAFYYDYKDKQLLTKLVLPVFRTGFTLANIDDSTVKGIEVDLQWLPTDNLTLSAAVGWLDSEVDNATGFNQKGENIDFAGSPLPFSAELQGNVTAKYEWEINNDLVAMFAIDVSYSDPTYSDFKSSSSQTVAYDNGNVPATDYTFDEYFLSDSHTIVNARLGLFESSGQWKTYLWARNLTDEYHESATIKNNEMLVRYASMPRTVGISVEYLWE